MDRVSPASDRILRASRTTGLPRFDPAREFRVGFINAFARFHSFPERAWEVRLCASGSGAPTTPLPQLTLLAHLLLTSLFFQGTRDPHVDAQPVALGRRLLQEAVTRGGELQPAPASCLDSTFSQRSKICEFALPVEGRDLPDAILMSALAKHRRFFVLRLRDGKLAPRGLMLVDPIREGKKCQIQELSAHLVELHRLYEQCRNRTLDHYAESSSTTVWHPRLGTLAGKIERLPSIARALLRALDLPTCEDAASRAAELCKVDLSTPIVRRHPYLHGAVGQALALEYGEKAEVARAIASHRVDQVGDAAAEDTLGALVSVSDRIDTIVMAFAHGLMPTPTADPLRLRETANSLLRVWIRHRFMLGLDDLVGIAGDALSGPRRWLHADDTRIRILGFLRHRLKLQLAEEFPIDAVHHRLKVADVCPTAAYDELSAALA